jgi:hypothetical protein
MYNSMPHHYPTMDGSKPLGQQFLISVVMMLSVKHHDKVIFFEFFLFFIELVRLQWIGGLSTTICSIH